MNRDPMDNGRQFGRDQSGGVTAFGLFATLAVVAVGGLALDVANAVRERTQLQVLADATAHAALKTRELGTVSQARAKALEVAETIMPAAVYGNTIAAGDIQFGYFNAATGGFEVDMSSREAVLVTTERSSTRSNGVGTFFLNVVGLDYWDIREHAVFSQFLAACFREGYVSDVNVDVTSNNYYHDGFCIHSNAIVEASSGNTYEDGVIVSMPDINNMVLPASGWTSNVGLSDALVAHQRDLRILERISGIAAGLEDPTSPYFRDYVTSSTVVSLDPSDKLEDGWIPGHIHRLECASSSKQVDSSNGVTLSDGVLITNCILKFPDSMTLENVAIVNTNDDVASIRAANNFTLGLDDGCSAGGGVQIVTLGGLKAASGVSFFGAQIIAMKDIQFTSDASAVEGVSLVAGGEIQATTNSEIRSCGGSGMEGNFVAYNFRLAS